jgi:uncharacterized tellurite resistance protein B-like protein
VDESTLQDFLARIDAEGCQRVYSLLFWMACCDGELHSREAEVLDRWAGLLKIQDREQIEAQVRQRAPLHLNASKPELDLLVKGLVEVVAADDWLDPEEEQRLRTLADLLGITQAQIQEALLAEDPSLKFHGGAG